MTRTIAKAQVWAWIGRDRGSVLRRGTSGLISWSRPKLRNGIFSRFQKHPGGQLHLEHFQTPAQVKALLEFLEPGEDHELRITLELRRRSPR